MQDPGPAMGRPRRRRQERTVYSAAQRAELERFFAENQYPTYQERETLAAGLGLQEHQVQVWFKNRRAKHSRLLGQPRCQGPGVHAAPQNPRACAPAPAAVGPVFPGGSTFPGSCAFPGGSMFPGGPGFCSPPAPSPLGVVPDPEPSISSCSQAWWAPAQGAAMVPPAPAQAPVPAPTPVWPQGPYASDFSPDPAVLPGFTELISPQDFLEGPSSCSTSAYQEGDDPANEAMGPTTSLDL